jgi:beta-phosphoglucomutase
MCYTEPAGPAGSRPGDPAAATRSPTMTTDATFPDPGAPTDGLAPLPASSDGLFVAGRDGVVTVWQTGDGAVEFIALRDRTLAHVRSAMGYPAYYPLLPAVLEKPVRAVLMDLDGTTVRSEGFWVWIIRLTTATLLGQADFQLDASDQPHVSGHSVSEHLQYCLRKYCPQKTVEEARVIYLEHARREMRRILDGQGRSDAFQPASGLREFLVALKTKGFRVALVTSGLHEKAYPEIVAAFRTLGMGRPEDWYDAIITAGFPLRQGGPGTLGELEPKPHPWLYAEVCRVGLGIPFEERAHVVGLEDSGAGVCAIRLAGFPAIGMSGGSIMESGTRSLCSAYCRSLDDVLRVIL